jgi:hypothetical protein
MSVDVPRRSVEGVVGGSSRAVFRVRRSHHHRGRHLDRRGFRCWRIGTDNIAGCAAGFRRASTRRGRTPCPGGCDTGRLVGARSPFARSTSDSDRCRPAGSGGRGGSAVGAASAAGAGTAVDSAAADSAHSTAGGISSSAVRARSANAACLRAGNSAACRRASGAAGSASQISVASAAVRGRARCGRPAERGANTPGESSRIW